MTSGNWLSFYDPVFSPATLGAAAVGFWAVRSRSFKVIGYGAALVFAAMAAYWAFQTVFVLEEPLSLWAAALIGGFSVLPTLVASSLVGAFLVPIRASPPKAGFAVLAVGVLIMPADLIAMVYAACTLGPDCI